ncbi:DsbA family protein [Microbacterium sp. NPDC056736]|uniref:DsbA family protein n=1 Tax=Microbacterium sp. NPDC056736 TaxID=3345932 RepID=UPI00366CC0AD
MTLITAAVVVLLIVATIVMVLVSRPATTDASTPAGELPATRADTHVLDEVGAGAPTLVEFLDFECEVCGALYPYIEELRAQYAGDINYAFRYFPLPGHANSMNAALAVEAAAQQGRVEEMFHKMFETQSEWGEQRESKAALFRTYAEELGLDVMAYDDAVADPATRVRIENDFNDGRKMGVGGTPTFYLDGQRLELNSLDDLTTAIDRALGR